MSLSTKQIKLANDLLVPLGYDPEDYDFDNMSKAEFDNLVKELKDEAGIEE